MVTGHSWAPTPTVTTSRVVVTEIASTSTTPATMQPQTVTAPDGWTFLFHLPPDAPPEIIITDHESTHQYGISGDIDPPRLQRELTAFNKQHVIPEQRSFTWPPTA